MAGAPARSRPNNLPAELTSFVGRRSELREVKRLLGQTRLLTLTGSEGAAGQHALGARRALALLVETLAAMASERGADARAAALPGYAQGLRDSIMLALPAFYESRHQACQRALRVRLGDAGFDRAFERGATMPDRVSSWPARWPVPLNRSAPKINYIVEGAGAGSTLTATSRQTKGA